MDLNVLILGSTGYLGSAVLEKFILQSPKSITTPRYDMGDITRQIWALDGVDVFINCAGVQGPVGESEKQSIREIERTFAVNLVSPIALINAVLPSMKRNNFGRIINLSGGGAADSRPNYAAYAASKAALVRYSECVADECKGYNITVNCVAPGKMNSKLAGNITTEQESEANRARAVELIYALTTPEYSHVTGRLIAAKWDDWKEFPNEVLPPWKYKLRRTT